MSIEMSPLDWLAALLERLDRQAKSIRVYEDYYEGKHPFDISTEKYKTEFQAMLNKVSDNWMPIIIDSVEERMSVQGFRINEAPNADSHAWDIWQRNGLDADINTGFQVAMTTGMAYTLVWEDPTDKGHARITVEHPSQVYVALEPGDKRKRMAAVKAWKDDWTDKRMANLFLPDGVFKFIEGDKDWQLLEQFANPLAVVPVVPMVNRPDLFGCGRSDLKEVMSTQDQINKLVKDMLVASEFAAFPQRWATGVEVELDEDGKPKNPWVAGLQRVFTSGAPDAKFGEFSPTDLGNYTRAIENRIQSLASRSKTPPHYLLGHSGQFPSGESLKATETGLVAKARKRMRTFGEALEETERLALQVEGQNIDGAFKAETLWANPESRSESELVDSLVKLKSLGVPNQVLWERYGFSPQEMARFSQYLLEEAINSGIAGGNVANTIGSDAGLGNGGGLSAQSNNPINQNQ